MTFIQIADDLNLTIESAKGLLIALSQTETSARPAPGKWSHKEILGHLMDSASNNHQRFVRAALQGELTFPGYDQDPLVALQRFNDLEWKFLVELWLVYNSFLAHVIRNLPPSAGAIICHIGKNKPANLLWIAEDYVAHLKHHLNQILGKKFETSYGAGA